MKNVRKIFGIFNHAVVRGSAVVLIGSTLANFFGWLYHLFVGRILGPGQYSELSALFAIFNILNVITGVIQMVLVKFFAVLKAREDFGQANALYWKVTRFVLVALVFGVIIVLPLTPVLSNYLHIANYGYFLLVYLIFATTTLTVAGGAALQGYQRFLPLTILSDVGMLIRLITGIIGAFFGVGWTLIASIISNIGTYFFYFIPLGFLFRYKTKPLTITKKDAVGLGIPVLLTMLSITILNSQDVLLVKHYFSDFNAGIYASLSVLGKIIFFASSAVGFVLFPVVAERKELKSDFKRSVFVGLSAVGGLSVLITFEYFLFPQLVVLPFGPAFAPAAPYLGWFGIFVTFYTIAYLLIYVLIAAGNNRVWIITAFFAVVQYLLISAIHTTLYQIIQANIITAIGLLGVLVIYYRYVTKKP